VYSELIIVEKALVNSKFCTVTLQLKCGKRCAFEGTRITFSEWHIPMFKLIQKVKSAFLKENNTGFAN